MVLAGVLALSTLWGSHSALVRPSTTVVVSWDGGGNWVVQRLVNEGKLPNVARLAKMGVFASSVKPPFPSKTAVSHFSLFSGTNPDTNGVVGNSVPLWPRNEHTILEQRSGFDANSHLVEPLWVTAAKNNLKVLALSAAGSYPPDPDVARLKEAKADLSNYREFSGFESKLEDGRMIEPNPWKESLVGPAGAIGKVRSFDFSVGETGFRFSIYRTKEGPRGEIAQLGEAGKVVSSSVLTASAAEDSVKYWSKPFRIVKGGLTANTLFRLWSLDFEAGKAELYQTKPAAIRGTESDEVNRTYEDAYGAFHDDAWWTYGRGGLGKTVWQGGNGEAEKRILEIVRLDCEFLKRSFRYGLKTWKPDLVFHYTPMSDSAGHTLMGMLDDQVESYKPELAAKVWPVYERVFQLQDEWLGDMMDAAGPNSAFCLVSDHGMEGTTKKLMVNKVLEEAGLLAYGPDNKLDLAKTKICSPPWGDNVLVVNSTAWKGGIVPPSEVNSVVEAARKALMAIKDPKTQHPIVTNAWSGSELAQVGNGGASGADLCIDVLPGYYPSGARAKSIIVNEELPKGAGNHGMWFERPKMRSIFVLGGYGVERLGLIPTIRTIDVTPTICALLGIPAPTTSQGIALKELIKPRG